MGNYYDCGFGGGIKLTQLQAINEDGYAVDARELNPSIGNTLANRIVSLQNFNNEHYRYFYVGGGKHTFRVYYTTTDDFHGAAFIFGESNNYPFCGMITYRGYTPLIETDKLIAEHHQGATGRDCYTKITISNYSSVGIIFTFSVSDDAIVFE